MINLRTIATSLTLVLLGLQFAGGQEPAAEISFNRDIRPILSDKCFHCHGPDENTREVDLRFDIRESAMDAIAPGSVEDSEMMARILDDDPDVQMPPPSIHKPLKPEEIKLLKTWIQQGANWDEFWAYAPPKRSEIPQTKDLDWSINWIDQMVLHRLESKQLAPSPKADRVTLIRRLYFDLIGLPPTPEQVNAFVDDTSPQAYEKIVDDLFASKHFGEKLATYWLDLVRFADTVGYHGDQDHNVSPYRDWVINSLNDNMPFDQFTREQLAGDLVPDSTRSQKIASGYNRLLQTTHEGGLQPQEYSAIYAADRVRNVSGVWMGATVGCAQCHDHKYDPYTAKDFYSLAAVFADVDDEKHFKSGTNTLPTKRAPELLILSTDDEIEYERQAKVLDEKRQSFERLKKEKAKADKAKKAAAEKTELELEKKNGKATEKRTGVTSDNDISLVSFNDDDLNERFSTAEKEFKNAQALTSKIEARGAWTMITQALETPRTLRVLPRGNWMDETRPVVSPSVPEFLSGPKSKKDQGFSRLDLAHWLTDNKSNNGKMTARVFANRFWYLLMGVGISKSLDDFGGQGEAPAYPELLDNLALEFAADWDVKNLMRQIVMSNTYRQSSLESEHLRKLDPYNQLFSHQSRYRLPAETVRDNALAISGLLNVDQIGGKSVKPYQPSGYYRHLNFPTRKYSHHTDSRQWRRGVYVHWQRMFLHPSLKAFDAPSREECTCERPRSNTPLAALSLLNDPCFVEAARVFAEKIMTSSEPQSVEGRIEFAFEWAVSRKPTDRERSIVKDLYATNKAEYQEYPAKAKQLLETGQAPLDAKLDPVELAAWTSVARAILNMSETISRN